MGVQGWGSLPGPAQPTGAAAGLGCPVWGEGQGGSAFGRAQAGSLQENRVRAELAKGSPRCSLSAELGVPQIMGHCPVFGPGLRDPMAHTLSPDAPSCP